MYLKPFIIYTKTTLLDFVIYKYIPNSLNMAIITYNPDREIVKVLTFAELMIRDGYTMGIFRNINLDKKYNTIPYIYNTTPSVTPSRATRELTYDDYEAKYLYYKNKYLKLKYSIIN